MSETIPLRVVFAEDDPDVVELVRIAVESQPDFELVATAAEAEAALSLIRELHPDVVILDHRLRDPHPGCRRIGVAAPQSGLELIEVARSAAPDATIVIFTGHTGLRRAAENAGADAYVEKPEIQELWSAIRDAREVATLPAD